MPPSSQHGQKGEMEEYFVIKRSIELPPKVNIILTIMERVIEIPDGWKSVSSNAKEHNKPFLQAFSKLDIEEQGHLMNQLIKYIVKLLNKKDEQVISNSSIQHIETSVQIHSTYMKFPIWPEFSFRLDKAKKIVYLSNKKKSQTIDLHQYLVRKSKKFRGCIVLQGVSSQVSKNQCKKYILCFHNELGEEVYQELFSIMLSIQQEQFHKIIEGNQNTIMKTKSYSGENSNMVFLSSKNINQFLNYKDTIVKYMLSTKVDFRLISSPNQKSYRIQQGIKSEKIFKLEANLFIQPRKAKQNFLNNLKKRKNSIIVSSQILQNFSSKYFALYQKYLISNKIQELITIREQSLAENQDLLFVKGIDNMMVKNFMEFMMVKIKKEPIGEDSRLIIVCSIFLDDYITPDVIKFYLRTLYENTLEDKSKVNKTRSLQINLQSSSEKAKEEDFDINDFHTVFGNAFNEQYVEFIEGDEELQSETKKHLDIPQKIKESNQHIEMKYLQHRYLLDPTDSYDLNQHLMKQHYLYTDWMRRKDGGVICKNQQIVNAQKKLFKDTITALGSQILKGGTNVLNLSLPVTIFKKQSHLCSISRNFCYAPLFLQKKFDNNLERMKYCTLLVISIGNLSIHMQKPFNPLLGETLQTWIGGCPMYLQQISHHPPRSAYYLVGRGYRLFGQIQPKISFGINNVKGYSERPNRIVFDDGTEIDLLFGKMIIYGMMFGEREFNFQDKVFAYDKTNHLFSQLCYGPKRKGMFSKSSEPWDFCFGKIYKIKQQFKQKFQLSYPRIFPTKQYIIKQISSFQGVWNESIEFDGIEYYNFRTQLPCEVTEQQFSLPSNSHYRKDLSFLLQGNIPQSQRYKQIMEQIQRRDKKLRQKHKADMKSQLANKQHEDKKVFIKK